MDPYVIISTLFTNDFVELFDHLDLTTEDFINHYKNTHSLTTFPFAVNTAPHEANDDDEVAREQEGDAEPRDGAEQRPATCPPAQRCERECAEQRDVERERERDARIARRCEQRNRIA